MKQLSKALTISKGLVLAGIIAAGAIVQGCYIQAKENDSNTSVSSLPPATPVDAVVLQPEALNEELEVTGNLLANQHVEIVSELTRKVTQVHVREGSHVRKNELLFQLDDADLQAQLQRLRQQEKLASLNETRMKDLIQNDAIVQQDYDEAFTNLKVLQAQIDELLVTLDKTRIVAPFDGQVGMINTHRGAVVSVNTTLTDIEDNSILKLEFSVPEKYAHKIALGSKQEFRIASDEQRYHATVYAKSPGLNSETRNLKIRAHATNPNQRLLPGQSARVSLTLGAGTDAVLVPSHALIPSPEGYSVLKATHGIAQLQPVEIGLRKLKSVEIKNGLTAGDTVIVSNLLRIGSGSPIHIVTLNK
ncbi:MAG TPA: efflux RND transporter periplasmic adaptor subunit [Chryseosolibacter sp.]